MRARARYIAVILPLFTPSLQTQAQDTPRNVFTYRNAEDARRLAREQCKPLVLHFLPDSPLGREQFNSFYRGGSVVGEKLLDHVVIVAVPTEKYAGLAHRLGITEAGGYRTVSAYDLSAMDNGAVATCRSGFV